MRPAIMRYTPLWLRHWLFYRRYSRHAAARPDLFQNARLAFAPDVRLALLPSDVAHQPIAWAGVYELRLSRQMARLAKRGGLLLDVGANYGYFTCLWAATLPANRVIAFEASPRNEAGLRHNVERNSLSGRVVIEPMAVARENGSMSFDVGPGEQTGWGHLSNESSGVTVRTIRLDSYCERAGIDWVDVLKVDVEGGDAWVLEGAQGLLDDRRIGTVFFEEEPQYMRRIGIEPGATSERLRRAGYAVTQIAPETFVGTAGKDGRRP